MPLHNIDLIPDTPVDLLSMSDREELAQSLRYAAKIQKAIMPHPETLRVMLPESFILFKPKELVSGDFYWFKEKSNHVVIAAGDCTGHGVPGAFMSILGITFLNEILLTQKQFKASRFLNQLRERVMHALNQNGDSITLRDGMDMSLIIYERESRRLQFAGANLPLYIIRKDELIELKGDRMPVGISGDDEFSFINQSFDLNPGDKVYLFTDGFTDQFGGPSGKKFKFPQFRKTLIQIQSSPMQEQLNVLRNVFQEWMGGEEQVDDTLVIGFCVEE